MDSDPPSNPVHPSTRRNVLEWALLGGALIGFVIVYIGAANASPIGFVIGIGLCAIIAVISIGLQFTATPSQQNSDPSHVTTQLEWPESFSRNLRKLIAALRATLK